MYLIIVFDIKNKTFCQRVSYFILRRLFLENKGTIALSYEWNIQMEAGGSVTFASDLPTARPLTAGPMVCRTSDSRSCSASTVYLLDLPHTPFSVEPASGSVPAGKTATIKVRFSPLDVNTHTAKLVATYVIVFIIVASLTALKLYACVTLALIWVCAYVKYSRCIFIAVFPTRRPAYNSQ